MSTRRYNPKCKDQAVRQMPSAMLFLLANAGRWPSL